MLEMPLAESTRRRLEAQIRSLRFLCRLTTLVNDRELPIEQLLRRVAEQLPQAYQYPAIARARVELADIAVQNLDFHPTMWEQTVTIGTLFPRTGALTVCYLEPRPEEAEGPFLEEERELLNTVGELLGERFEREQMEEALRRGEQRLATVLGNTPIILWSVDREGVVRLLQGEKLQRFGLDPGEVIGFPYTQLESLSGELSAGFRRAVAGEQVVGDISLNGRVLQSRFLPLRDAGGRADGAIGVQMDVTRRKQAEHDLARTNRLLEEIFAGTHFLIAYLDRDLRYRRVNRAYAQAAGREPAGFIGRSHVEMFSDPALAGLIRDALKRQASFSTQDLALPYLRGIGGSNWDMDLLPVGQHSETQGVVLILIDRSRRKQALDELEKSRAELKRLASHLQDLREEERRRIAREIHDELGGLLTSVKMDLSLARRGLQASKSDAESAMGQVETLVDQSLVLIRRIAYDLRPQILDDLGLVPALEWLVAEFRKRTTIRCRLAAPAEEPAIPKDMATALFRIVQEALTNITRHAAARSVDIELRPKERGLSLRVADDGCGISPEQADDPSSFGLIGIRERVLHLGGRLEIRGRPGKGTTLVVELPC